MIESKTSNTTSTDVFAAGRWAGENAEWGIFRGIENVFKTENLDAEEKFIVGGDFNCPLDPILDKKGGSMLPRSSVLERIACLQEDLDLVNIWRVKNPLFLIALLEINL